jgi:hypothetical protein
MNKYNYTYKYKYKYKYEAIDGTETQRVIQAKTPCDCKPKEDLVEVDADSYVRVRNDTEWWNTLRIKIAYSLPGDPRRHGIKKPPTVGGGEFKDVPLPGNAQRVDVEIEHRPFLFWESVCLFQSVPLLFCLRVTRERLFGDLICAPC